MNDTGMVTTAQAWLQRVEAICTERGLHLTPLRRQVLELLASAPAPLGAYTVLDGISKGLGKAAGPPTVYRVLDFLVENGFAFKILSRNAYVRCDHLGHSHHGTLLICSACGRTSEVDFADLDDAISRLALENKFRALRQIVEIEGVCQACSKL